jgi:hypothetical protein
MVKKKKENGMKEKELNGLIDRRRRCKIIIIITKFNHIK